MISTNQYNSSLASRAKSNLDYNSETNNRSSIDSNFAGYNPNYSQKLKDFIDTNGKSNPPFMFNNWERPPGGQLPPQRGYIRRSDTSDDIGGASLNFMFNPDQITRDYVSYLDQAALDPFNTLYQSGNLINPPSFVNFSFSLFFDRQDDIVAGKNSPFFQKDDAPGSQGVLIDYQYFDLVVRNVVPSIRGNNDVPDNGVMMVNPKDITVVFSPLLTVQGRPTNARVSFTKFDNTMTPTRMMVDLTMIITYFGPIRSSFGTDTFQAIKQYEALVPYTDVVKDGYTDEDVAAAVSFYNTKVSERAAASGAVDQAWYGGTISEAGSGPVELAAGAVGGAAISSSEPNARLREGALAVARNLVANDAGYSQQVRTGPKYDCSGLLWVAYRFMGAPEILAGTPSYAPSTAGIVAYQKARNWATMPVVVEIGRRKNNPDVIRALQATLQPGDILLKSGHVSFFAGWADPATKKIPIEVAARSTKSGCLEFNSSLGSITGGYDWACRPVKAGSQSIAGSQPGKKSNPLAGIGSPVSV